MAEQSDDLRRLAHVQAVTRRAARRFRRRQLLVNGAGVAAAGIGVAALDLWHPAWGWRWLGDCVVFGVVFALMRRGERSASGVYDGPPGRSYLVAAGVGLGGMAVATVAGRVQGFGAALLYSGILFAAFAGAAWWVGRER